MSRYDPFGPLGITERLIQDIRRVDTWREALRQLDPFDRYGLSTVELMRELVESPTARAMREFRERERRWLDALGGPASARAAFEEIERQSRASLVAQNQMKDIAKQAGMFSLADSALSAGVAARAYEEALTRSQSALRALEAASGSEALLAMAERAGALYALRRRQQELALRYGQPMMDAADAMAIGEMWGVQGLARQMRALGLDDRLVARLLEETGEGLAEGPAPKRGKLSLSRANLLNILLAIWAILTPLYAEWSSNQAEARLTKKIEESEARQAKKDEEREAGLRRFLEQIAEQIEAIVNVPVEMDEEISFVVRERATLVRAEPESGSKIVATIFPNQVVTLIEEEGKWIQVEYFDWLEQDHRSGWCLKKYLSRLPARAATAPGAAPHDAR